MSEFIGLVQMSAKDASALATETIANINRKRQEYLERSIQYLMDEPPVIKKRLFGAAEIVKQQLTRDQALNSLKVFDFSMFESHYSTIMNYWRDTENECNNIICATSRIDVDVVYIPIKSVAFFEALNK